MLWMKRQTHSTSWRCTKHVKGVASWLPTTVTAPLQDIHGALQRIAHRYHSGGPGAQVLGSYLEGPYFTPQNKGAHPPELFRELELNELDELIAISRQTLRVVALAPEKPGLIAGYSAPQATGCQGDAGS